MSSLLPLVGLFAAIVGMVCSVPQIWRLARSPHAAGVSYSSSVLGALSSATWLAYGALLADSAQLLANSVALVGAVVILVLLVRRSSVAVFPGVCAAMAWLAAVSVVYALGGVSALGMCGTAIGLVCRAPQLRTMFAGGSLAALSPVSLVLGFVSALAWTIYGFGVGQAPVWSSALCGTLIGGVVLIRRSPPRLVALSLHHGRWGAPGRVLVAPVAPLILRAS